MEQTAQKTSSALLRLASQALSLIALLTTLIIFVSYMFVFKERDLEEIVKPLVEETEEPRHLHHPPAPYLPKARCARQAGVA
ncbi:MAG: hypothetical protein LBS98_03890 [Coriobacteriales bacterium]|jgi:hypothetical protein|nr:hypothetical protein [Coriobacteriales bacterium]